MDGTVLDFYSGYEGEGEIQFIQILGNEKTYTIRIWDGYFDDIMEKIEPEVGGWTNLAYYYNLAEGWYDESPWKIPNISDALRQIEQVGNSQFHFEKTKEVFEQVCMLLKNAIKNNNIVYIARK